MRNGAQVKRFLVILLVGLIAGWLPGQISRGAGFGLVGNVFIGVAGAYVGGLLPPRLGIPPGAGIGVIVNAASGALVFLLVAGLFCGGGDWPGDWLRWRPW